MFEKIRLNMFCTCTATMNLSQQALFVKTFKIIFKVLRIFGFLPFSFHAKKKFFSPSFVASIYTVFILLTIYLIFMLCSYYSMIWLEIVRAANGKIYFKAVYIAFNITSSVVAILVTLKNQKEIVDILNKIWQVWSLLEQTSPKMADRKLLKSVIVKILLVDVIPGACVFSYRYQYDVANNKSYAHQGLLFTLLQFITSLNIHNMFIVLFYVGTHIYRLININFSNLNLKIKRLEKGLSFWRLQPEKRNEILHFIEAQLNQLVTLHFLLNEITQKLVQIHALTLLLIVMTDFLVITYSLYSMYVTTVLEQQRGREPQLSSYGFHVFVVYFTLLQAFYFVRSAMHYTKRAGKAGLILEDQRNDCSEDRLSRTITSFTVQMVYQDCRIMCFNMFEIDFTLIRSMLASITNYFVIIMQLQLSI
uniref:Gustatory receptor n=1 Tax=Culex quinquefasciatus TaxID=7176 RepID=A0A1S4KJT0_CULQU